MDKTIETIKGWLSLFGGAADWILAILVIIIGYFLCKLIERLVKEALGKATFDDKLAKFLGKDYLSSAFLNCFLATGMTTKLFRSLPLLLVVFGLSSCKSRNPQPFEAIPVELPPAEYPQPGVDGEIPEVPGGTAPGPDGGRFGYRGNDGAPTPPTPPAPPAPPKPGGGTRDFTDLAGSGGGSTTSPPATTPPRKEEPPAPPKPSGPPSASQMPYANPVPGNPLVVTLPGKNASLGQISVEKYDSAGNPTGEALKRGTQVQIPDPNNPGKRIYFKVP